MKVLFTIVAIFTGLLLASAVGEFPDWGDPNSPANSGIAAHYLENSLPDTHVPNVVTTVLADYRSFDTMMETMVVFVAGMAILSLIRRGARREKGAEDRRDHFQGSFIIRTASQIMIPFMQLFSLYVVAHGHYSPGGGFQGGVILGASVILYALAFGLKPAFKKLSEKATIRLAAIGVLIYFGTGLLCLLLGANFMDYSVLAPLLMSDEVMARSHSMLIVEIGVAIAVMTAMFSIYADMSSRGQLDEGV